MSSLHQQIYKQTATMKNSCEEKASWEKWATNVRRNSWGEIRASGKEKILLSEGKIEGKSRELKAPNCEIYFSSLWVADASFYRF